ncbi:MAG: bifunctional histidinol-phosphatase/imidazoleglycerol-phosphate dehydratase HisB [Bacteroidia bacterium]
MKKVLFIDRDGTLIWEPPETFQVDSFTQLKFIPGVITALGKIARELDFELVMVTNQDGLGTASYPEEQFRPIQNLIMRTLESEGIVFSEVCIDTSFEHENKPTRKPNTGMLTKYMNGLYDLKNSYVIGDRITDIKLAQNLGAQCVFLKNFEDPKEFKNSIALITEDWNSIYNFLRLPPRTVFHKRYTNETQIELQINMDGTGQASISTGLGFFDHMLEQIAKHGAIDLSLNCKGDLHIDEHHTVEDTAIALGEAIALALGDKKGTERYGFMLPMDDCLAQVALDFGGRSWIVWNAEFKREKIGDVPTELFFHFFKSFSDAAKCNLNIKAEGDNEHHKIEAIFKAFARSVKMAVKRDKNNMSLPSTKGIL